MSKLSTKPYKGTRDFYPEDMSLRKWMFGIWGEVCERWGYEEYDGPIIEPLDLYTAKTSEEIVNEQTYSFEDRGGRKVTIRPEMTPTVSRMVAGRRQELSYPLRWYSIPNCMRYERPQRGRLREFWQLNVDLFGVDSLEADIEVIKLADQIMKSFGARDDMYGIKLNSRKLLNFVLDVYLDLNKDDAQKVLKLVDHVEKLTTEEFEKKTKGILGSRNADLHNLLQSRNIDELPQEVRVHSSASELERVISDLKANGVNNAEFDFTIARGFDYYTDIVFEVFDKDPENNRSMFGGGRYDALVGEFGVEPVPSVGFGMGDITLQNFLSSHGLIPEIITQTRVYVVVIGANQEHANDLAGRLRNENINVAVDLSGRKPEKQLKSAIKKGIPFAVFVGDEEAKTGLFTLKELSSKTEEKLKSEQIVKKVRA